MMYYLRRFERVFLVTVFLSMVALFALNVLAREIGGTFASQLAWIEEAVRLMNIFLVFGALGLALEKGRHVGIDTLRESLPATARNSIRRIIDAVGCLFSAYMSYLAYHLVVFVLNTGQRSPTLDVPIGWIYMAPVVGFGLLSLRYALSFLSVIDRFDQDNDEANDGTAERAQ
ncbi:MAG: TRAP transporter small permease [Alphaproteobacteria bacterium]|nr:TRAP transporter small permease [Alphaproteobacteria bacterium]